MPKAVIFDLLTALVDSWSLWDAAAGSKDAGHRWRSRYLEITFGCGKYRPYEDLVRESARDTGMRDEAAADLISNWDQLQPWPDVKDVLLLLRKRGYRLVVVTNCSIDLGRRAADRCGIAFDAVLTAEEVGYYKPQPETYHGAIAAAGVAASDALFVAGSNGDVIGAAAAGLDVVWHNRIGLPALPGSAPLVEGKSLRETLGAWIGYQGVPRSLIPTPSVYMNRTTFTTNCQRMRQRATALDAAFRVHIKTHKTVEGTELELQGTEGRVITSTLKEIEHIEPLIRQGLVTSVLYGVPPPKTSLPRLAALRRKFPIEMILMVDHPSQIKQLEERNTSEKWPIFINIDCGTRREGIEPNSEELAELITAALQSSRVTIHGFYCHAGHSYGSNSLEEAERHLLHEITTGRSAVEQCLSLQPDLDLTLSVGATPTAHAASSTTREMVQSLPAKLELHAGNFAVLDLQQVSTGLTQLDDVASFIEAEVCSVYPKRGEVLLNIGALGIGREPGREPGVWGRAKIIGAEKEDSYPWNLVRISQEHGIMAPRTDDRAEQDRIIQGVAVGSCVRIIPQHACIAGAMHESYLVVDEEEGEVVDEWIRCRGW
ncbi:hypothetical protein FE257_009098 [Aspergillus nanangensis]|uniref:D-serine dehydratase n=1 Tax=Aspergillus nanangensis TaxID=2582783 RepID=A0AAD4CWP9_ASPNN|nr:hypothetical protein FE257_009098 [Aspergillus nanangensis]